MKPSKAERRKQSKILEIKQEIRGKAIYAAFIACAALCVIVGVRKPLSIGSDFNYVFFVIALPIMTGISLLIYYRKKLLNPDAPKITNIWQKFGYSIATFLVASLLSFITIGTFASILFETANYYTAQDSKQQTVILPVDEFHKGRGSKATHSIRFHFNDKKEYISVSSNFIHQCIRQSSVKHHIKLKLRKGLWNHYLVDDFDIIK